MNLPEGTWASPAGLDVADGQLHAGVAAVVALEPQHGAVAVGQNGVVVEGDVEGQLRARCGPHPPDDQPQLDLVAGAFEGGVGCFGHVGAAVQPVGNGRPGVFGDGLDGGADRREHFDGHREVHVVVAAGGHERAAVKRRVGADRQVPARAGFAHAAVGLAHQAGRGRLDAPGTPVDPS